MSSQITTSAPTLTYAQKGNIASFVNIKKLLASGNFFPPHFTIEKAAGFYSLNTKLNL